MSTLARLLVVAVLGVLASNAARAGVEFHIDVDAGVAPKPVSGRLIVLVIQEGARLRSGVQPIDGPFWDDPQPIFGMDVTTLTAGTSVVMADTADGFPVRPHELPAGTYRAQARLDVARQDSEWRRHEGNLYSEAVVFRVAPGESRKPVRLTLTHATTLEKPKIVEGLEWFECRSRLLSEFRGREVLLRAGVVLPKGYDASKAYAAVYEVPGFGGNHHDAVRVARARARNLGDDALARSTFWIVLDPEGPNGHTLFADSANNGPCGEALVKELIPALEAKYSLRKEAKARLLRGHSSGGWSTLWLATTYPETFGACWSSAPDPVDFRRFQRINIYEQANFYTNEGEDGQPLEIASYRGRGNLMTVRQEARGEDVIGPDNTSAQQWDSWFAVFGPRNDRGHPAALFDPESGVIDHGVAETYRAYDLGVRLRSAPGTYAPIFRERVRLVVGEQDSFFLNEAVALLKSDLETLSANETPGSAMGYVKIVPDHDHGSIFGSKEILEFPREMKEHLDRAGLLAK
jgi:hypothetical protein